MHVSLECNSMYICTVQLASGAFHWAIVLTDDNMRAVRHHWYQVSGQPYAETYGAQVISPSSSTGNSAVLGYYKINDYHPSPDFIDLCRTVFTSHASVDQNRANGLTCRTWIIAVLDALYERGSFPNRKEGSISDFTSSIEKQVKEMSTQADHNFLSLFFRSSTHHYRPPVVSL